MVDKLRLEILLAAVDKVTGPLKAIAAGSQTTAKALGQTEAALKSLQAQQKNLAKFDPVPFLYLHCRLHPVIVEAYDCNTAYGLCSLNTLCWHASHGQV